MTSAPPPPLPPPRSDGEAKVSSDLRICTVCASNQNRSMEAHRLLAKAGFQVSSFGTGSAVRLPGPSVHKPNIYMFGTPYNEIYNELEAQDPELYVLNGVLKMLDRNRKIKRAPERWQDHKQIFDIVFTCEERCFDAVCDDLINRGESLNRLVHVINVDIKDNHEEAIVGGKGILALAEMLADHAKDTATQSLDNAIISILHEWQQKHPNLPVLHAVCYF